MSQNKANESEETLETSESTMGEAAPMDVMELESGNRISELEAELEVAKAKAEENWNIALRAKAEVENIKRRAEIDVANAHKFSSVKFIEAILPVVDSVELGLAAVADEGANVTKFKEGNELTLKMLMAVLDNNNIQQINPLGEKFNPVCHQAMSMQEDPTVEPNTVLNVVQKGYQLHERVIRPAMVIVSKATSQPPKDASFDEMA